MLLAALTTTLLTATIDQPISVTTYDGKTMVLAEQPATVVVFVTTTCPIARAMQPTLTKLHQEFSPKGVQFLAVQVDVTLEKEDIKTYVEEYKTPLFQTIDSKHRLVNTFKAKVTPEAIVLNKEGKVTYQGRIDNTYPEIGIKKPPTTHELKDAITATLSGNSPTITKTTPVGCIIPDLDDF